MNAQPIEFVNYTNRTSAHKSIPNGCVPLSYRRPDLGQSQHGWFNKKLFFTSFSAFSSAVMLDANLAR